MPAPFCVDVPVLKKNEDGSGNQHAAKSTRNRQQGILQARQFAYIYFPLQLQSDKQEKDGHQSVIDPVGDAFTGYGIVPEFLIGMARAAVADDQRKQGATQQDQSARFFAFKKILEKLREFVILLRNTCLLHALFFDLQVK